MGAVRPYALIALAVGCACSRGAPTRGPVGLPSTAPAQAFAEAGASGLATMADAASPHAESSVTTCAASIRQRFEEACTRNVPASLTEAHSYRIKRRTVEPSSGWPPGETTLRILADEGRVEGIAQQEAELPTVDGAGVLSARWRVGEWVQWCERQFGVVDVAWTELAVNDKVGTIAGSIHTMTSRLSLDAIRERILPVTRLCPNDASALLVTGER